MFVSPGDKLYEGMVIGIHSRDNDLVVNPIKGKQLTNVRASGTDEAMRLMPPIAADARIRGRVHRRRRAGRSDAAVDPHPQAPPEGTRAQAREPRSGLNHARLTAAVRAASLGARRASSSIPMAVTRPITPAASPRSRSPNIAAEYPAKLDHVLASAARRALPPRRCIRHSTAASTGIPACTCTGCSRGYGAAFPASPAGATSTRASIGAWRPTRSRRKCAYLARRAQPVVRAHATAGPGC